VNILLVVNNPKRWPLKIPGVQVVQARRYLTEAAFTRIPNARVFNLCKSYRYQSTGYYVSLLAAARGHKPIPDVSAIRDLQSPSVIRFVSEDLENLIQTSLSRIHADRFVLSIYFGRNTAKRYDRLSQELFNLFRAPLLRAFFIRSNHKWELQNVGPIGVSEVPDSHRDFLVRVSTEFFAGRRRHLRTRRPARFNLAILLNPRESHPPSDPRAIRMFERAAEKLDIEVDLIGPDEFGRIPEYDALFIRETTAVNNHTFRFARRAEAEGLVVVDDSESILKCTNKVYLAELLKRHRIPHPDTIIVHRDNVDILHYDLGLPCILKQPDSAFSEGVVKVNSFDELQRAAQALLEKSELIIAQEYLPTEYDWRIGIFDGKPLYACKYYMARSHWQIVKHRKSGRFSEGKVDTVAIHKAPRDVVTTAVRAANLIGKGLYGVDLKEDRRGPRVIEINDNPSIEAGYEDEILKEKLYEDIMRVFLRRLEEWHQGDAER